MGFQGNLDSVSFADILQLLAMGKKTGTLYLEKGDTCKEVSFKSGSIIWASSNDENDMLENQLLKQGKLDKDDLAKAKEIMRLTNRNLPSTLVFLGLFNKEEVSDIILNHVESIIFGIFGWDEGRFVFKDNELADSLHIINALNTMNILMEGTRRIDEWSKIRGALPTDNTVMKVVQSTMEDKEEIRLSSLEAQILSLVDGERSIEEIMERSPHGELDTSRGLYSLKMAGIIRKVGVKESRKASISEKKEVLQLMVKIYDIVIDVIREVLTQKLGNAGVKRIANNFEEIKHDYGILGHIDITDEGKLDFVNFLTMIEKMPESSQIHEVSSGLSAFLEKLIESVQSIVGSRQKKQIISKSLDRIEASISGKIELLKKYGVYSDLNRTLKL
ncbi:MAG: DUF4388 domain-containing protein [bacterium]